MHERDRDAAAERTTVDGTFSERATLDGDFELIPIPGHTPGATAFLWDSGEHRMLFTGDSVFLDDGEWVAAIVGGSDRASYVESLSSCRSWSSTCSSRGCERPAGRPTPSPMRRTRGGGSARSRIACGAASAAEARKLRRYCGGSLRGTGCTIGASAA